MSEQRTERHPNRRIQRLRERKQRHKQRSLPYRFAFATSGVVVILGGLALVPLPGPGWLIVAIGVGMLALEFDRAERLVEQLYHRLEQAAEQAARAGPVQKALGIALVLAGVGAAAAAVLVWDVPFLPG